MTVTLTESAVKAESQRMMRLQIIIDEVSKRAEDSDLVTLLATIPRFIDSPKNRLPWGDFWIRHGA
jgi:hypothetical protein